MNDYFWIPHIHSEVRGIKTILKRSRLLQKILLESIGDIENVDAVSITHSKDVAILTIGLDRPGDVQRINVVIQDSGLCRIEPSPDDEIIRLSSCEILIRVASAIVHSLGNRTYVNNDNDGQDIWNHRKDFELISAENDHDAVVEMFNTAITSCEIRMDYITDSNGDPFRLFECINKMIEHISITESFIESAKESIPDEYDGMMKTLRRHRQNIYDRREMIRINRDIRRERGQQELNSHALSISRSVYYLSVLGIGVSMFGASIVADSLISISPLMKAGLVSMASASVVTACWWISKRMSDRRSSGNGSNLSDLSRFRSDSWWPVHHHMNSTGLTTQIPSTLTTFLSTPILCILWNITSPVWSTPQWTYI